MQRDEFLRSLGLVTLTAFARQKRCWNGAGGRLS